MSLFAPTPLVDAPSLKLWALFAALFQFKLIANSLVQGYTRVKGGVVGTPEDAEFFFKGKLKAGEEPPQAIRAGWVWENDVENIPFFLFLSLGFVLTGGHYDWCLVLFSVYFISRILHMIALLRASQPWRAIYFGIGMAVCLILAVGMILNFFRSHSPL